MAVNTSQTLTLSAFIYILIFASVWGRSWDASPILVEDSEAISSISATEAAPVPVPEPTSKAMAYYRSGNLLWVVSTLWAMAVPAGLAFSGFSAKLRDLAQRLARGWFFTIMIYMIMLLAIIYIINLPFSFYLGFIRQHAYGLSNQTPGRWMRNSILNLGVDMIGAVAFIWVPYLLLSRSQGRWWIYMSFLWIPFLFFVMLVSPVWIDPLFNDFGPMRNKELERSVLALAQRAGIEGSRVFEVDRSVDTHAVNAYVKGIGQSKRIVLWDTLIKKLDEPELLVVMGHEMGHYVLGHVVRSILLSSILILVGLFLIDRMGRWLVGRYRGRLGFDRLGDIASVPLMMMLLEAVFLVLGPVGLAYSRIQEHEADEYALELTRTNHAAATAHVKLLTENLGNPRPGLLYKVFRASHPSAGERIDFANSYHPWRDDRTAAQQQPWEETIGDRTTSRLPEHVGPEKNTKSSK
jgi:Zn-dependent protease with chaperone function